MNDRSLYFRLLTYVIPYWKRLALSAFLLALLAASEPIFPALMKPLIDDGFTNHNKSVIEWVPIAIIALFFLRGMITFASSYASAWVANRVVADLRTEMFSHLLHLPVSFFDQNSSARISSHVAYDVGAVTGAATSALTVIVRDSLTVLALLSWLLWLDWKLTSITLAMIPFIALTVRYFNRRLRKVSSQGQYAMAGITHSIEEAATNNRIIKIHSAEEYEADNFRSINEKQRNISMRATVASSALTPLVQIIASFSVAIIIAVSLNSSYENSATAGEFMGFLTALLLLLPPIKRLTGITGTIQRGLAAAEMVFSIIDEHTERRNGSSLQNKNIANGKIEFKNIYFKYPESKEPILESFSLQIPAGQTIALVGRSGSGKTTITSLLSGFYCIQNGDILLNNVSFKNIPLKEIRKNIALVSQDVRLFNNTVLYNVAYGENNPDTDKVKQSLIAAHAMEFVDQLPDGVNTLVGQNGVKLSGGQRQRISIARAFYKDPPILILDEATSALDTESERNVQAALDELMMDRTTIVIAHRLSTIERADRIIVMDNGNIREEGNHKELLKANGLYAHYYQLQFSDTY